MIRRGFNFLGSSIRHNLVFGIAGLNKLTGTYWVFFNDDQWYIELLLLPVHDDEPVVTLILEEIWSIGTPSTSENPYGTRIFDFVFENFEQALLLY